MNKDTLKQLLRVLLDQDMRVWFCTLYKKNKVWEHDSERCPRCTAIRIIES